MKRNGDNYIGHFPFIRHLIIVFSDKSWIFPGLFKFHLIILKNYLRAFSGYFFPILNGSYLIGTQYTDFKVYS